MEYDHANVSDKANTLRAQDHGHPPVICLQGNKSDRDTKMNKTISFQERSGKPGGGKGILTQYEHTGALTTFTNQYVCFQKREIPQNDIFKVESMGHDERSTQFGKNGCCDTLIESDHKQPIIVCYGRMEKNDDEKLGRNGYSFNIDNHERGRTTNAGQG